MPAFQMRMTLVTKTRDAEDEAAWDKNPLDREAALNSLLTLKHFDLELSFLQAFVAD
jgi:hypothetical protein